MKRLFIDVAALFFERQSPSIKRDRLIKPQTRLCTQQRRIMLLLLGVKRTISFLFIAILPGVHPIGHDERIGDHIIVHITISAKLKDGAIAAIRGDARSISIKARHTDLSYLIDLKEPSPE